MLSEADGTGIGGAVSRPAIVFESRCPYIEILEFGRALVVRQEIPHHADPPGVRVVGQIQLGSQDIVQE